MEACELRVRSADGRSFAVAFQGRELTIGRSRGCDVVLEDAYLSRQHAVLEKQDGRLVLIDTSRNGTFVGGHRVHEPRELKPGEVIEVGRHQIALVGDRELTMSGTIWVDASDLDLTSTDQGSVLQAAGRERYTERLRLVNEIHEVTSGHVSEADLLDLILKRSCDQLKAECGDIFLRRGDALYSRLSSGDTKRAGLIPYSRRLLHWVCEHSKAARIPDTFKDLPMGQSESMIGAEVRSLIAAPIPGDDCALGMLVLGCRRSDRFDDDDLSLLVTLASVAGLKVHNMRLVEEAARKREEIALSRQVQESLLPRQLPDIPGCELYAENVPSLGVSGDHYQVFSRKNGREWFLMVLDVSGKGMPAALLTASIDALAQGPVETGLGPATVCQQVSRSLFRRTLPQRYATAFFAVLDGETGRLCFSNAGHVPGLLIRTSGEVAELTSTGPPLGLVEGLGFSSQELSLEAGDLLVVVSDGVTEAESVSGEEYGLERLRLLVQAERRLDLEGLAERVRLDVDEFTGGASPSDDRTILLLRRIERP